MVGEFVDAIQDRYPSVSPRDLAATVEVFTRFEEARSGYGLLQRLAQCSPDDIDNWNDIMREWTASRAKLVLGELERRLKLISELESLLLTAGADELHQIQPLFERGLWVFGPEYEAVDFQSNRTMATLIRQFFGNRAAAGSRERPDFVATSDSSIGAYASPRYVDGEVDGWSKVLIVELKTTGLELTQREIDQARDYAKELVRTGTISQSTEVVANVLGTRIEPYLEKLTTGSISVRPMTYEIILRSAHARTFNLHRRLSEQNPIAPDQEAEAAVLDAGQRIA